MTLFLNRLIFTASLFLILVTPIFGQETPLNRQDDMSEMQLIQRVAELQHQLESSQLAERDAAEKELLKLGTLVLDHLEPPTDDTPSDAIQRTNRVRLELEKIAVASVTKASKVTLGGTMTVDSALAQLRQQTGNDVDLGDQVPDVFRQQNVEIKLNDVEFWRALSELMSQAKLVVDPYAGEPGQLRLGPTQDARIAAANPGLDGAPPQDAAGNPIRQIVLPHDISGVFDLTVTKISSSRNLQNPKLDYCNITVQVRWEPRVQPISIDLPVDSIRAVDEFDNPITIGKEQKVMHGIVQPEIPELEFMIPIGLVDRQIEFIKSLEATIDAVIPGRMETFRFKNVGKIDVGTEQRKAGAVVTFGGLRKNDDLYGVKVRLSFDDAANALESHQGWAFNNPVYLENGEGKKFEPVALETLRQDKNEMAIQYYFKEDPAEMTLVYKTAAAIVQVPVKITLKNIPLP